MSIISAWEHFVRAKVNEHVFWILEKAVSCRHLNTLLSDVERQKCDWHNFHCHIYLLNDDDEPVIQRHSSASVCLCRVNYIPH